MKYIVLKTHAKKVGLSLYVKGQIVDAKDMEEPQLKLKPIIQRDGSILREPLIAEYVQNEVQEHVQKQEKQTIETKEEKAVKKTKRPGRPRKTKIK